MAVSKKISRIFMCAAVAAVLGVAGAPAQATAYYDVIFDPSFTGEVKFAIGDGCKAKSDGIYVAIGVCEVDLVFADIFDSTGQEWVSGPQSFVGLLVQIVHGELAQFLSRPILLEPIPPDEPSSDFLALTSGHDEDCDGILQFFISRQGPPPTTFQGCHSSQSDSDTYTLVPGTLTSTIPEPGTLGLILGGIGAAWLTRRRKRAA
jgi:hypothetical protein